MLLCERFAGGEHVLVHPLDPRDEAIEVARPARLAHAVDVHAAALLEARSVVGADDAAPAREHVNCDSLADERLRELAYMARQPALDHGRVLPGEDEHAVADWRDPI